ncbi:MAG: hypothetical protein QW734_02920 [Candidatus Bathyarchaeia archaeon]
MTVVRVRISELLMEALRGLPISEVIRNAIYMYLPLLLNHNSSSNLLTEIVKEIEIQIEKMKHEKRMHELRVEELNVQIQRSEEILKVLKEKKNALKDYFDLIRRRVVETFKDDIHRLKKEQIRNRIRNLSIELTVPEAFLMNILYEEFGGDGHVELS